MDTQARREAALACILDLGELLLTSGAELACPVCGGTRGHPILMSANVIDRVLEDSGESE